MKVSVDVSLYGASWCNKCSTMDSMINRIIDEYKDELDITLRVYDIDDISDDVVKRLEIESLPVTFISLYGMTIERIDGVNPKAVKSKFENVLGMVGEFSMESALDNVAHYQHACDKHPKFCDCFTTMSKDEIGEGLDVFRSTLKKEIKDKNIEATDVLFCEMYEMLEAYVNKDYKHAEYEARDCIAVIGRMIDVFRDGLKKDGDKECHKE